jgi:hypothetical protein
LFFVLSVRDNSLHEVCIVSFGNTGNAIVVVIHVYDQDLLMRVSITWMHLDIYESISELDCLDNIFESYSACEYEMCILLRIVSEIVCHIAYIISESLKMQNNSPKNPPSSSFLQHSHEKTIDNMNISVLCI